MLKAGTCKYDYVEVMACPGGCLSGGAQSKIEGEKVRKVGEHLSSLMHQNNANLQAEYWFENACIAQLTEDIWSGKSKYISFEDTVYKIKSVQGTDNPVAMKW
jgi:NADH-quinone oxidoreductase subunit G